MDNALKFDKVDAAAPRPVQPRPGRPRRPRSTPARCDRRKADPKFQKQEERIKKYRRPQGPALDLAQRGQVPGRVRPRRRRREGRRGEGQEGQGQEEEVHRAPRLGVRLLQRRGRPDRRRLPDPRLQGPGRDPGPRCSEPLTAWPGRRGVRSRGYLAPGACVDRQGRLQVPSGPGPTASVVLPPRPRTGS